MARINLLPWREELHRKRKNDFIAMLLAGIVLTLLVMAGWHMFNLQLIDAQNGRNQQLKNEIALVNQKIKEIEDIDETRQKLQVRIDVIQELQRSRPESVRLMDEMVFMMPEGVVLDKVEQASSTVVVEGMAQSNARVSALMRNVDESKWIKDPQLHIIENKQADDNQGMNHFRLTLFQKKTEKKDSGAGE